MKLKTLFAKRAGGTLGALEDDLALFKHFSVVRKLGSGSYATVYQVLRHSDHQHYACKHVEIMAIDAAQRSELVSEIRLLASLDHPNLIRYHEAFVDRSQLFIISELVPGGDLGTLLEMQAEHSDWLPERKVWSYFLQLTLGVQYLHHNHVLHRDLKPQNVLIGEGGLLKLADLGLSQIVDHVFTHAVCGTPQYVSPEMYRNQPYSYSADVWALGCILYEMCSLKPLFLEPTERGIRKKVLSGLLDPIPKQYSLDLWDLIRAMLAPNPCDRPTIDEILDMPSVRAHLSLLPAEELPLLDHTQHGSAKLLKLIRLSGRFDNWDELNELLPPSKYASGPGVVDTLRMPRSSSCPELAGLDSPDSPDSSGFSAAAAGGAVGAAAVDAAGAAGGCSGSDSGSGSSTAAGRPNLSRGGGGGRAQGGPPQLSRVSIRHPLLRGAGSGGAAEGPTLEALGLWRKSVAVGQMLHHLQAQAEAAAGERPADTFSLKRTLSAGDIQDAVAHARRAASCLPWASSRPGGGVDMSPLQFGGVMAPAGHSRSSRRSSVAAAANQPSPAAALHASAASSGCTGTSSGSSGGGVTAKLFFQALSSSAAPAGAAEPAGGELSGHGGSPRGVLAAQNWSSHSNSSMLGDVGCAMAGGTATGSAGGSPAGGAGKKEKRVKFKRLRKLLFGDEDGGAMHQPLW